MSCRSLVNFTVVQICVLENVSRFELKYFNNNNNDAIAGLTGRSSRLKLGKHSGLLFLLHHS